MTLVAVVLVATCLVAGLWAVWAEHVDRRRERADARMLEHVDRRRIPQGRTRGAAPSRGSRFAARARGHGAKALWCANGAPAPRHVEIVKTPYDWEEHDA